MIYWLVIASTVLPTFIISLIAVAWVRHFAERLGLLDKPGHRKVHTVPVPLGGGLGIWAAMLMTFAAGTLAVYLFPDSSNWLPTVIAEQLPGLRRQAGELWVLLAGGTILVALGLADDRRGIPWQLRLLVEFGVATFVVYRQGLQLTAFIDLPWFTGMLSVIWIVALINSFNMLDNMDGLSGGVAAISAGMLAAMLLIQPTSGHQPQLFVAAMLLTLTGSLMGFLWHNWPPARIFMGDAGSYVVGYWIAISTLLATYTGYQAESPQAVLAPLFVLAIPLYDMLSVIWIRVREGRSPFEGDKRHFSHRLVDLGLSKKHAVLTIYLATSTCSMCALLLPRTDLVGAILLLIIVISMLLLVAILEHKSLRRRTSQEDR